mmetsp:Transcript_52020/g.111331  ORF Transcript_52020/g.111331 Transcript_52020/m.111331 type:complete len:388 (+) Transcript_52020:241-1404(+)
MASRGEERPTGIFARSARLSGGWFSGVSQRIETDGCGTLKWAGVAPKSACCIEEATYSTVPVAIGAVRTILWRRRLRIFPSRDSQLRPPSSEAKMRNGSTDATPTTGPTGPSHLIWKLTPAMAQVLPSRCCTSRCCQPKCANTASSARPMSRGVNTGAGAMPAATKETEGGVPEETAATASLVTTGGRTARSSGSAAPKSSFAAAGSAPGSDSATASPSEPAESAPVSATPGCSDWEFNVGPIGGLPSRSRQEMPTPASRISRPWPGPPRARPSRLSGPSGRPSTLSMIAGLTPGSTSPIIATGAASGAVAVCPTSRPASETSPAPAPRASGAEAAGPTTPDAAADSGIAGLVECEGARPVTSSPESAKSFGPSGPDPMTSAGSTGM